MSQSSGSNIRIEMSAIFDAGVANMYRRAARFDTFVASVCAIVSGACFGVMLESINHDDTAGTIAGAAGGAIIGAVAVLPFRQAIWKSYEAGICDAQAQTAQTNLQSVVPESAAAPVIPDDYAYITIYEPGVQV